MVTEMLLNTAIKDDWGWNSNTYKKRERVSEWGKMRGVVVFRYTTNVCTVAHICKHNKQFLKHNTIFLKHKSIFVIHNTKLLKHKSVFVKHNTKLSKHNAKLIIKTQHKIIETQSSMQN